MRLPSARALSAALFLATISAMVVAPTGLRAQEATSGMTGFLPPPPPGWTSTMPPRVTEDENGLEPAVGQAYGPSTPGAKGGISVTINHPSPHDLKVAFPADRPLGPHPLAPEMVTTHHVINDLDAYLITNTGTPGGVLLMKVGRVLVGINGSDVSREQIIAMARSIDTSRLLKY